MGNTLKVNCKELYKTGAYITLQVKELDEIVTHMKNINEEIKNAWDGNDYDAFYQNFNEYLSDIKNLECSLIDQSAIIKSVAVKHGRIDKNLYDDLKRGIIDER